MADLTRRAGCAPCTLARRFTAGTGTTPLRWLAAQRVMKARRLLAAGDLPVDQVAAVAGSGTAAILRLHLA